MWSFGLKTRSIIDLIDSVPSFSCSREGELPSSTMSRLGDSKLRGGARREELCLGESGECVWRVGLVWGCAGVTCPQCFLFYSPHLVRQPRTGSHNNQQPTLGSNGMRAEIRLACLSRVQAGSPKLRISERSGLHWSSHDNFHLAVGGEAIVDGKEMNGNTDAEWFEHRISCQVGKNWGLWQENWQRIEPVRNL